MTERSLFWRRHLEAINAEGISTADYAYREGLTPSMLYQWRRKLKVADESFGVGGMDASPRFVPLRVMDAPLDLASRDWVIRLQGVEFSFPSRPDASWLAELLLTLQQGERHASRA